MLQKSVFMILVTVGVEEELQVISDCVCCSKTCTCFCFAQRAMVSEAHMYCILVHLGTTSTALQAE